MGESLLPLHAYLLNENQDSPPTQFRPDALDGMTRKFLTQVTNDDLEAAMSWLRFLAVTPYHYGLQWDAFQSLYHDHLNTMTILPLLRRYPCWGVCRASDFDFFTNRNRAQQFYIDGGKAMEDFTLACLSVLPREEGSTEYVPLSTITLDTNRSL